MLDFEEMAGDDDFLDDYIQQMSYKKLPRESPKVINPFAIDHPEPERNNSPNEFRLTPKSSPKASPQASPKAANQD